MKNKLNRLDFWKEIFLINFLEIDLVISNNSLQIILNNRLWEDKNENNKTFKKNIKKEK